MSTKSYRASFKGVSKYLANLNESVWGLTLEDVLRTVQSSRGSGERWLVEGVKIRWSADMASNLYDLDYWSLTLVVMLGYITVGLVFTMLMYPAVVMHPDMYETATADGQSVLRATFCLSISALAQTAVNLTELTPKSSYTIILVTTEHFAGVLMAAVLLGILINKASVPAAMVVFSDSLLLTSRDGVPMVIARLGNTRGNFLLNPEIRIGYMQVQHTEEGESIVKLIPMEFEEPAALAPCLNIACRITEDSPLWGKTYDDLAAEGACFYIGLAATDNSHYQEVFARKFYTLQDIKFNCHFADVLKKVRSHRAVDFNKFNDLIENSSMPISYGLSYEEIVALNGVDVAPADRSSDHGRSGSAHSSSVTGLAPGGSEALSNGSGWTPVDIASARTEASTDLRTRSMLHVEENIPAWDLADANTPDYNEAPETEYSQTASLSHAMLAGDDPQDALSQVTGKGADDPDISLTMDRFEETIADELAGNVALQIAAQQQSDADAARASSAADSGSIAAAAAGGARASAPRSGAPCASSTGVHAVAPSLLSASSTADRLTPAPSRDATPFATDEPAFSPAPSTSGLHPQGSSMSHDLSFSIAQQQSLGSGSGAAGAVRPAPSHSRQGSLETGPPFLLQPHPQDDSPPRTGPPDASLPRAAAAAAALAASTKLSAGLAPVRTAPAVASASGAAALRGAAAHRPDPLTAAARAPPRAVPSPAPAVAGPPAARDEDGDGAPTALPTFARVKPRLTSLRSLQPVEMGAGLRAGRGVAPAERADTASSATVRMMAKRWRKRVQHPPVPEDSEVLSPQGVRGSDRPSASAASAARRRNTALQDMILGSMAARRHSVFLHAPPKNPKDPPFKKET